MLWELPAYYFLSDFHLPVRSTLYCLYMIRKLKKNRFSKMVIATLYVFLKYLLSFLFRVIAH